MYSIKELFCYSLKHRRALENNDIPAWIKLNDLSSTLERNLNRLILLLKGTEQRFVATVESPSPATASVTVRYQCLTSKQV